MAILRFVSKFKNCKWYSLKLKTSRKGLGRFIVSVTGKSAHAGVEPEKGVSAIVELSHVIQKVHIDQNPDSLM